MLTTINELISNYNDKHFKKKTWKPLSKETEAIFQSLVGENGGLLGCNIRASANNFVSKIIGHYSTYKEHGKKTPLSHSVIVYYGDITKALSGHPVFLEILESKLAKYYVNPPLLSEIKSWVLCSADENGMNYFDFSVYENRDYSLRPYWTLDYNMQKSIIKDFIAQWNKPYDYTGLIFWPLYKIFKFFRIFDDVKSWFCSEVCYEILKKHGYYISNKQNPSPADLEKINLFAPMKYRTKGFLR